MLLLIVIGQTLVIYALLVLVLSRVGRSLLAGLTHFDYLVVALLGSAVETGLYRGSSSLSAGLVSAATLIVADKLLSAALNRWPRLRRLLAGTTVVLIYDGQLLHDHLHRVRLSEADVRAAVRKRGYENLDAIHLAVMELNGEIGVVPKPQTSGT
jgi:uncharacterized membrane protein YcaP (DUF421 family)